MDLKVSINLDGRELPVIVHDKNLYSEVPPSGEYKIRISNQANKRRLVVVSVDGVNVVNGEEASPDGLGYVVGPWQTIDIPGFLRTNQEVAAFTLSSEEESYTNQIGLGTSNNGVIGVAIFEEKKPSIFISSLAMGGDALSEHTRVFSQEASMNSISANYSCTVSMDAVATELVREAPVVSTAYGAKKEFVTMETDFERATTLPSKVLSLYYGVRARLKTWGVPVVDTVALPKAFPRSTASVPAPPGWQG